MWVIEVKVGAGFRRGSLRCSEDEDSESVTEDRLDREDVNQLENYQGWLASQTAADRARFVSPCETCEKTFLPKLSKGVTLLIKPPGLAVESWLVQPDIPLDEQMLGRHFAAL